MTLVESDLTFDKAMQAAKTAEKDAKRLQNKETEKTPDPTAEVNKVREESYRKQVARRNEQMWSLT